MKAIIHFLFGHYWVDIGMKYIEELHGHRLAQECLRCGKKRLYTPGWYVEGKFVKKDKDYTYID
jgi:hypothetical protein